MQRWARACWREIPTNSQFSADAPRRSHTLLRPSASQAWDADTLTCASTQTGHEGGVYAVACRGAAVVTSSSDKTVRVWDGAAVAAAASGGAMATLPPTSEPTKEFVARQHTKLAPYKPHAPGASSSFHDALSPGGADPLKERADDLLRAMV